MADVHGGDGAMIARHLGMDPSSVLDLSASLNPVAPDAAEIVAKHLDEVTRYPDAAIATAALAESLGADVDRVLLTNGGSEAIALVAADAGRGWVEEPDFSLYRRHLPVLDPLGPRFRSNPHNPSGQLAGPSEHADVWDEAFYPLATGRWTRGEGIVVGSLTKVFACPGLRLGYVLADEDLIARLRARQPAWSVSGLAAAALPDLLERADLPAWATEVRRLRDALVAVLAGAGLTAEPSDANYVLVRAPGLRDRLLGSGIVVRDCASFGLDEFVRIAVPDEPGIQRLAAALAR
jgi:histidinol-phosphate/aromatic aminotransferase/cobyric acid decarboxylase-like protein